MRAVDDCGFGASWENPLGPLSPRMTWGDIFGEPIEVVRPGWGPNGVKERVNMMRQMGYAKLNVRSLFCARVFFTGQCQRMRIAVH